MSSYIMVAVLGVLLVFFFVMSSRSNKKKKKEAEEMMAKFKKGCYVKTIGGIMGKVVSINDNEGTFVLETGSNQHKCMIKFDKQAIYQISEGKKSNRVDPDEVEEVAEPVETVEAVEAEEVVETVEENATSKLNGEEINN